MALNLNTVWEVRTTGSDTLCSGGFNSTNSSFLTNGSATSANTSAPIFTSASYNFVASDVGAWLFIQSGTNSIPGWYQIASVAANAATLTAAIGTGQLYGGAAGATNYALSYTPSTVVGIASVASPTSIKFGIDYSQQNAAQFAFTDMIIDPVTNTNFTSALKPVGKNFIGNLIKITAGVNFTVQTVEVVSTSGTVATCDKSLGTVAAINGVGYLGGAYAGPQLIGPLLINGMKIYMKSGAYAVNSATPSVTGGLFTSAANIYIEGYGTTRGDMGTAPVFTASAISGVAIFSMTVATGFFKNITVDCATLGTMTAFSGTGNAPLYDNCIAKNATTAGFSNGIMYKCTADTCGTGYNTARTKLSVAKSCATGFGGTTVSTNCIAYTCTTGFGTPSAGGYVINCLAYNGTTGFTSSNVSVFYLNCLSHTNTTGFDIISGGGNRINCASWNDGTTQIFNPSSPFISTGFITLTADPCVSVAGNNFALNNTAGGGAALQGTAQTFPSIISTTTYPDVGATQTQKPTISSG